MVRERRFSRTVPRSLSYLNGWMGGQFAERRMLEKIQVWNEGHKFSFKHLGLTYVYSI